MGWEGRYQKLGSGEVLVFGLCWESTLTVCTVGHGRLPVPWVQHGVDSTGWTSWVTRSSILVSLLQVGWAGGVTGVHCLVKVVVRK